MHACMLETRRASPPPHVAVRIAVSPGLSAAECETPRYYLNNNIYIYILIFNLHVARDDSLDLALTSTYIPMCG